MKKLINHALQLSNKISEALFSQSTAEIVGNTASSPISETEKPKVRPRDILVQDNLLQRMIAEKDFTQQEILGFALIQSFERSLQHDKNHNHENEESVAFKDISTDDAFWIIMNEIGRPSRSMEDDHRPDAMDRAVKEYISPKLLGRDDSLKIIQGLIDTHTIDRTDYQKLTSRAQISSSLVYTQSQ